MTRFARGVDFPNEGFVQQAIEKYFCESGYQLIIGGYADLVCLHEKTQQKWVVEAKGKTIAVGLDFRTGLGQLVQRMTDPNVNYAIAVPDILQFSNQYSQLATWVRQSLNLYVLLVNEQGVVQVISPLDQII